MNLTTEQDNPNSRHIDRMTALEMVELINREDAKVAAAVREALPQIAEAVDAIADAIESGGRLFYIGAGTSGRLGVLDAVECVPTFSTPPDLVQGVIAGGAAALTRSVEGAEDDPELAKRNLEQRGLTERDVVCGIAASGRTPYVIGALQSAGLIGAKTLAVACNKDSPIGALADIAITADVGPEIIAGSTRIKAGTAQKMILNMLSTATMIRLGKVYRNLMVDVKVTNQKLEDRACRLVMRLTGMDESKACQLLAQSNNQVKTAVVMQQRGVSYEDANDLLARAKGHLGKVIDEDGG